MSKVKDVLGEYFTLIVIIAMAIISNIIKGYFNTYIFIIVIIFLSKRHNYLGEKVVVETRGKGLITYAISGEKKYHILDLFTIIVICLLFIWKDFYVCLILFVLWFVITDIFRVRYTIYETYISRWFYTSKISINNDKWKLHIADDDPFPSVPHMHAKNSSLKLDIYTGNIYNTKISKEPIMIAKKKEFKSLWADKKFLESVAKAREIYKEKNPRYKMQEYPKF